MEIFEQALLLDVPVLLICAFLLLKYGNLSFSHPAITYLVFHVHVVTLRLIGLIFGDGATLYSKWEGPFDPVTPEEMARAALYFDIALVAMTMTWLWLRSQKARGPGESSRPLSPSTVWAVIVVSFVLGIVGLVVAAQLPGFQPNERTAALGEWQTSSYIAITQTWCGLALLAYIYCYGFRRTPVVLLGLYLLIMAFQGYHRFRVVIPVIMLAQIWLDQRRLRWPPKWMVASFLVLMFLFFPLKVIGRMWQRGASISEIGTLVSESVGQVLTGEADDQMFLDQLASALTLIDMSGRRYFGSIYLALFTLPIPRQWWPDKPGLAGFLADISIPTRPMKETGMVVTFIGEAYANFGILGVILVPPLLAAALTVLYRNAYRANYNTVVRFGYVLVCATLIQVYRDGLLSLVIFTFVNSLPLVMIVLLHGVPRLKPRLQLVNGPVGR
jgi:hypothetical protein